MKRYKVRRIYKYSETVMIPARTKEEAEKIAANADIEGERIHDDYLYDCEVISEEEL